MTLIQRINEDENLLELSEKLLERRFNYRPEDNKEFDASLIRELWDEELDEFAFLKIALASKRVWEPDFSVQDNQKKTEISSNVQELLRLAQFILAAKDSGMPLEKLLNEVKKESWKKRDKQLQAAFNEWKLQERAIVNNNFKEIAQYPEKFETFINEKKRDEITTGYDQLCQDTEVYGQTLTEEQNRQESDISATPMQRALLQKEIEWFNVSKDILESAKGKTPLEKLGAIREFHRFQQDLNKSPHSRKVLESSRTKPWYVKAFYYTVGLLYTLSKQFSSFIKYRKCVFFQPAEEGRQDRLRKSENFEKPMWPEESHFKNQLDKSTTSSEGQTSQQGEGEFELDGDLPPKLVPRHR